MFSLCALGIHPFDDEIFHATKSRLVDETLSNYGVAMTQIDFKNMS